MRYEKCWCFTWEKSRKPSGNGEKNLGKTDGGELATFIVFVGEFTRVFDT